MSAISPEAREFWQGCEAGQLKLQHCPACSTWQHYPRYVCASCGREDPEWRIASGRGTVIASSAVHRAFGPFREAAPYVVALVRLEEGPVMMSNLIDCDVDAPTHADVPVEVRFRPRIGGDGLVPVFAPSKSENEESR